MAQPTRTVMNRTTILQTVAGDVHIRNRWPRKDKYKGPPELPADFHTSEKVERNLDALQVLQLSRYQPLSPNALAVPLEYLHESQPWMVQRDVNIFPPIRGDIWSRVYSKKYYDYELDDLVARYEDALTSKPYNFWPIDVSPPDGQEPPHWILVVLHLTRHLSEDDDLDGLDIGLEGRYNLVESFAVVHPYWRRNARDLEDGVADFLEQLLPRFGIEISKWDTREYPWVPPSEKWSYGLRLFEMVRVWLDRITESYCYEPHRHDQRKFWAPHSGWINLDAVRSNMIGMAAAKVNQSMRSTTRIAIEPILDHAMVHVPDNRTVATQSMNPKMFLGGAYLPGKKLLEPTLVDYAPFMVEVDLDGNEIERKADVVVETDENGVEGKEGGEDEGQGE